MRWILFYLCLLIVPARGLETCGAQHTLFIRCGDLRLDGLADRVDAGLRKASRGKAWLQWSSVEGPLTCYPPGYDRIVLLYPCGQQELSSRGTVGKTCVDTSRGPAMASVAWIYVPNGAGTEEVARVVVHELGHGFGFRHGNTAGVAYGDDDDLMGTGFHEFSPQWRWEAHWLDPEQQVEAQGTGDYCLRAGQVLRIGLSGAAYFVEGVQVRLGGPDDATRMLDLDQSSLVDAQRGVCLTLLRQDGDSVTLRLEMREAPR